jgi:hypothetical protein
VVQEVTVSFNLPSAKLSFALRTSLNARLPTQMLASQNRLLANPDKMLASPSQMLANQNGMLANQNGMLANQKSAGRETTFLLREPE